MNPNHQKADYIKENMGLTTWKNSPDGRSLKSDVIIAKNYLDEKQIKRYELYYKFVTEFGI